MLWVIGFLIVLVALLIPILAIVLDSPAIQKLVESRRATAVTGIGDIEQRLHTLEDEMDDLGHTVRQLKDETQFLQRLIEEAGQQPAKQLPPES